MASCSVSKLQAVWPWRRVKVPAVRYQYMGNGPRKQSPSTIRRI